MTPLSKQTEEKHCTCTRTEGLHQSHCPLFDGKECACDCHDTFHYCYKNPPCCPIIVPKAVANAEEAFDKIWEPIHVGYNGSELDFNHQQKIRSLFLSLLLSQRQEIVKSLEGMKKKVFQDETGVHIPRPSDHRYNDALSAAISIITKQDK